MYNHVDNDNSMCKGSTPLVGSISKCAILRNLKPNSK